MLHEKGSAPRGAQICRYELDLTARTELTGGRTRGAAPGSRYCLLNKPKDEIKVICDKH